MKFSILRYYQIGDEVMNKRSKRIGTVIKPGHTPTVNFSNTFGQSENMRISGKYLKLVHPVEVLIKSKIKKLKSWIS